MTKKIPAWAYIEAQILFEACAKDMLAPAVRSIAEKYDLPLSDLGKGIFSSNKNPFSALFAYRCAKRVLEP